MWHTRVGILALVALLVIGFVVNPTLVAQPRPMVVDSYYSPRLRANLHLERMSIPGQVFYGARIVGMEWDSPLRHLHLQLGDVVTRLDGIPVSMNMYRVGGPEGYWALPQIEKHYGHTEVRYIRSGTTRVVNGWVDLGPFYPQPYPPGGPEPIPPIAP